MAAARARQRRQGAEQVSKLASLIKSMGKIPKELKDGLEIIGDFKEAGAVAGAVEAADVVGTEGEQVAAAVEEKFGAAARAGAGESSGGFFPALGKGLGVLSVVGGGAELTSGAEQLASARYLQGSGNVVGGALNTAAGVTMVSGKASEAVSGVLKAAGATEIVGGRLPVAGPLAGAAGIVSGGIGIYEGIKSGNTGEIATSSVTTVGGGLMVAGAFLDGTVAGAPVGVVLNLAGGAMMVGATVAQNWGAISHGVASAASWAGHEITAGAGAVVNEAGKVGGAVVGGVESAASGLANTAAKAANDLNPTNW